jgi:hypothetical protein
MPESRVSGPIRASKNATCGFDDADLADGAPTTCSPNCRKTGRFVGKSLSRKKVGVDLR